MAQGEGGRGWSSVVLGRGAAVLDGLVGLGPPVEFAAKYAWGPEGAESSSVNHEAGMWSAEAVRAAAWGTPSERDRAFDVLTGTYFPREFASLWGPEQMAPDNHSHQHLQGTSLARVAAVKSGNAELLRLSESLLRRTVGALLAVATSDLQVWTAGMRPVRNDETGGYERPFAGMASAWLRLARTGDPGLSSLRGKNAARAWRDPGMGCLRALRWLRQQGDRVVLALDGEPLAPCALRYPMTVYRGDRAHLAVIDPHSGAPEHDVCDWCLVTYGGGKRQRDRVNADVDFGCDFKTQPPSPPAGSYVVRFPGQRGGGDSR